MIYRHERPSDPDDPLNDQNIRDRYYGSNDPVADKIMKRAETLPSLNPPEDPLITTLYIGGLGDESDANPISEQDLRNHFYQYGEIRQVTVVPKQGCAFIQVNSMIFTFPYENRLLYYNNSGDSMFKTGMNMGFLQILQKNHVN